MWLSNPGNEASKTTESVPRALLCTILCIVLISAVESSLVTVGASAEPIQLLDWESASEESVEAEKRASCVSEADIGGDSLVVENSASPGAQLAARASGAESVLQESGEPVHIRPELTPFLTFAAIEEAWNMGWVDSIIGFFPDEKITLRLETNAPEEAFFSRKQAGYVLRDAFSYKGTEAFEFLEFRYDKGGEEPPFGNAQWSFRREPAGETIIEKVHVELRKEGERWLISEIAIVD